MNCVQRKYSEAALLLVGRQIPAKNLHLPADVKLSSRNASMPHMMWKSALTCFCRMVLRQSYNLGPSLFPLTTVEMHAV